MANAANLLPPPVVEPVPIPELCCASNLYLKGSVGLHQQEADVLSNNIIDAGNFTIVKTARRSSGSVSAGSIPNGSASTAPANIAARQRFAGLTGTTPLPRRTTIRA